MWVWQDYTACLFLLNVLLCVTETVLKDPGCEIYNMTKDYSTRDYFTCIRDSTLTTLSPSKTCTVTGRDWTVIGNITVYVCLDNKYKIIDQAKWTSGDLVEHQQCTNPDNEEQIVAFRSECVLLTRQKYNWDDAVNACNSIGAVQQLQIIENISRVQQTFLEQFLFKKSVRDEVWIGLHAQGGRIRWYSGRGKVDFIPYEDGAPESSGDCYATGAAGTDRVGGGWRGRPCNNTLPVLCQTRRTPHVTTEPPGSNVITTEKTTDYSQTTTATTKTSTVKTEATSQPSTGSTITSITETPKPSPSDTSVTIPRPTTTDRTGNATEGTIDSQTDTTWIYIVVAVVVTVVLLVCAALIFINRRRRRKSLLSQRTEAVEYSAPSNVNHSTPFVNSSDMYDEANYVRLQEKTTLYSHIHNPGGAQDSTYDTANHKGTQPSPTLDATYDRANLIRQESPDEGVYDVTRKQTVNSWQTEEIPSSTYDHAFITERPN